MDALAVRYPHAIDVHVGARIRMRRRILSMSQEELARGIGLTFQQVQKYERGANRVSASKLHLIAHKLGVSISYFFNGLPEPVDTGEADAAIIGEISAFMRTAEGLRLAQAFPKIRSGPIRRTLLELTEFSSGCIGQGDRRRHARRS